MHELKKLGVTTIFYLRGEFASTRNREREQARSVDVQFVLIPGNGWSPPSDEQMAQFFSLVAERPKHTIFVHCRRK